MTDLTTIEPTVVPIPGTGEALDLSGPLDTLARALYEVRHHEQELRTLKALVAAEIHNRFDANAKWSDKTEGFEIRGESPDRVEYDVDALRATLTDLVAYGKLTPEAAAAGVKEEVTYKASKRGLSALLKLGGEVADRVRACERPVDRPRRVTVKAAA